MKDQRAIFRLYLEGIDQYVHSDISWIKLRGSGRCHELRIPDRQASWRIVYRLDADAVVILEVFAKKTAATPKAVTETCRRRLQSYDARRQRGRTR